MICEVMAVVYLGKEVLNSKLGKSLLSLATQAASHAAEDLAKAKAEIEAKTAATPAES